jgi:hypothetical protein
MSQNGFWKQFNPMNNSQVVMGINYGFINKVHYLFPQGGGPRGAYSTWAQVKQQLQSKDVVVLGGVLREQGTSPANVFDVTIIGAANNPRQATSGGVPTGGGACWLAPSSGAVAATPLLEIFSAGWQVINIEFTPHTSSAGLRFTRSASVDATDGSHFTVQDCWFSANGGTSQIGIEDNGGSSFGVIDSNVFQSLTGTAIKGISTASNVPQMWQISNNRFNGNTNAIGMSLNDGLVLNNYIRQTANDTNFKINLIAVSAQGANNQVLFNVFSDAAANVTIAKGYKPGTGDVWRNYVTDTAAQIITVPA